MGKSAFTTALCEHASVNLKKPVAFFSLEMSKEQLVQRMLCSFARVDAQKVRTKSVASGLAEIDAGRGKIIRSAALH